jgi:hypothetical protein
MVMVRLSKSGMNSMNMDFPFLVTGAGQQLSAATVNPAVNSRFECLGFARSRNW